MKKWEYTDEWFEEGNISKKIKRYLEKSGYIITRFNEEKTQRGHDIEAKNGGKKLIIEVKGYPSDKYVTGDRAGQKKPTHPILQAKHWFAEALLSLILAKSKEPDSLIAVGLPEVKRYSNLLNDIRYFREKFGLLCYFVNKNGHIKLI